MRRRGMVWLSMCMLMLMFVPHAGQAQSGPAVHRPLPPSILAELRRSQHVRTLTYHDTIFSSEIARSHFNDSVQAQYSDSALAIVDTAVTLSHKEWLDSELVEIPELSRFGNTVHFTYPPAIMTETDLQQVPFDSTLLAQMNPVTRENLPFFDQSPIPMSLPPAHPTEAFVALRGGNLTYPSIDGWLEHALNPSTSIDAAIIGHFNTEVPLRTYLHAAASVDAGYGPDPADFPFHSGRLNLTLGYTLAKTDAVTESARIDAFDHSVSDFDAGISLVGDASDRLRYRGLMFDHEWNDAHSGADPESSQQADLSLEYDPYITHLRVLAGAGLEHASETSRTGMWDSPGLNAEHLDLLFGRRKFEVFEWYVGATVLHADEGTDQFTSILPLVRVRLPLNPRWEVGANFEPMVQLSDWRTLTIANPFFASYLFGQRSVVMDQINLQGFMNYTLSSDDAVRLEARFITRKHEPVFRTQRPTDSLLVFYTSTSHDTRHLELTASGSFLIFTRDVLTASATISHASFVDLPDSLPFEPTMKAEATIHFNSISNTIFPAVEFLTVSRPGFTMGLLNLEARWTVSNSVSVLVRAENILGSPSDFWPGYSEYPRSAWASITYRF